MTAEALPASLAEIVDDFASAEPRDRLELLLEYSHSLPPLPERYAAHPERLEPVPECQSPLFVAIELDEARRVRLFMDAPAESPTTRGFAGLFQAGLDGLPAAEVLAVPDNFYVRMGLEEVLTPLRLRGMGAIIGAVKSLVRSQLDQRRPSRRP